jgi:methyltransferase (TIGR00027 family)
MAASRTAGYVALYRALESSVTAREPLFRDPFASAFLPDRYRYAVKLARIGVLRTALERYADSRAPGARTSAIARTRFIDDVLTDAVRTRNQVVILGAGFDCRAHRLDALRAATVFEVDRPETQAVKRAHFAHGVHYVGVDFSKDEVAARLEGAGWTPDAPSVFVWEGVTNYLDAEAVAGVLTWIGASAPGSLLVFTYVHRGLLDRTETFHGGEQLMRNAKNLGEPWTFGLYPSRVEAFLAPFGLTLKEDLGADDYRARYGLEQTGYRFYRVAVATVD